MAPQQPINPGDITIDRSKLGMTAPARQVHHAEGPLPGGLNIDRAAFAAYVPPPPTKETPPAAEDHISVRLLPLGGCQHPLGARWAAEDLDIEGCTRCGMAQVFRRGDGLSWESHEGWTLAARQAGVIPPG